MGDASEMVTRGEDDRPRRRTILVGGLGVVAGGYIGATLGIFITMPLLARTIGPPLSWLLGVAAGGGIGALIGAYLALRLDRREIR
jgi:uncharacterized membrane protein YfcA